MSITAGDLRTNSAEVTQIIPCAASEYSARQDATETVVILLDAPVLPGYAEEIPVDSANDTVILELPEPELTLESVFRSSRPRDIQDSGGHGLANRPDNRSKKERRAGRKAYKRAKAHYGKTYVVTREQLLWAVVVSIGLIMLISASLTRVNMWMLEQMGYLIQ